MNSTPTATPEFVKKIEKELAKEEKTEEARVKHALKDVSSIEKAQGKAQKALHKAESTLTKADKKETSATKALNKATHNHEIAVSNLHSAEQDTKFKKDQDAKLHRELETKKAQADAVLEEQEAHKRAREAKLAQIHEMANTQNLPVAHDNNISVERGLSA